MRYSTMLVLLATTALPFQAEATPATKKTLGVASSRDMAIAAEVGADAISSYDVANRIKFIVATARLSNAPDVIEKIRPQVIRSLIDERLQLQEAERNDIKIGDKDVEQAIAAIEEQRGMPPGTINHIMESGNVPRETFTQQIRAQLSWNKLLARKVRPSIRVSDEEITLASQRFTPAPTKKAVTGPQEFKIAAITLPVEKKSADAEVRKLGEKLVKEVRGGASFEEVSRQFSSVAASAGGKVETFWIRLSQLDANVARALNGADAGSITDPVRTNEGYTIIKVYDTRGKAGVKAGAAEEKPKDIEVKIKEILLKLKPDADNKEADVMLQIGEEVAKHPGTCEEKGLASIGNLDDFDIEVNFREQAMSELPPAIKIIAESLKIGDISTPFASYEGIRLYMLCGKKETDAKPVNRDEVYRMLLQQKMELEAQKYLRNLRREVFVDVR